MLTFFVGFFAFHLALRPVSSDLCVGIPPNTTQLCHINCPVECEVSSWSAWGPCTYENCQDQTAKKGTRSCTASAIGVHVIHIGKRLLCRVSFTCKTPNGETVQVTVAFSSLLFFYTTNQANDWLQVCRIPRLSLSDHLAARLESFILIHSNFKCISHMVATDTTQLVTAWRFQTTFFFRSWCQLQTDTRSSFFFFLQLPCFLPTSKLA